MLTFILPYIFQRPIELPWNFRKLMAKFVFSCDRVEDVQNFETTRLNPNDFYRRAFIDKFGNFFHQITFFL